MNSSGIEYFKDQEFCQKLLTAIYACRIVGLDEPEKFMSSSEFKNAYHCIKKIGVSRVLNNETLNLNIEDVQTRHIICDYSNSSRKRLVVAVTLTPDSKFPFEFYRTIHDIGAFAESSRYEFGEFNYINSAVVYHASKLPVGYLRDKWLKEGYELLFTGYGFGAAIAAFLAVRLLLTGDEEVLTQEERVLFIGFSCPLFVGSTFSEFIEKKKHGDKFHFYRDENDAEVSFRDLQTLIGISAREWNLQKKDFEKSDLNPIKLKVLIYRELFQFHQTELWNLTSKYINEGFNQSKDMLTRMDSIISNITDLTEIYPKEKFYVKFGLCFEFGKKTINLIKTLSKSIVFKSKSSIGVDKYLDKHISDLAKPLYRQASTISDVKLITDIKIPTNDTKFVKFRDFYEQAAQNIEFKNFYYTVIVIRRQFEFDVAFGISCRNMQNIFCATWNVGAKKILSKGVRFDKNSIWFNFSYPTVMDKDYFQVELNTFFEKFELQRQISKDARVEINIFEFEVDKTASIYQLAIDVLYIHAIFFVQTIRMLKKRDKLEQKTLTQNESNQQLSQTTPSKNVSVNNEQFEKIFSGVENLINVFDRIDEILTNSKSIPYNEKEKEYVKAMFERFTIDVNDDFLKNFVWKEKLKRTFQDILKAADENTKNKDEKLLMALLEDLIPKVYFLKRAHVESVWRIKMFLHDIVTYSQIYDGETTNITSFATFAIQRFFWYMHKDKEDNHKYEYIVSNIAKTLKPDSNSDSKPYLGFYEEIAHNYWQKNNGNIQEKDGLKKNHVEPIVHNFRIRQILAQNHVLGVIGLRNVGKSRFVKIMTGTSEDISSYNLETDHIAAYRVVDDLIMIDYPHHNSDNPFYRVQFEYSKFLHNYVFLILDPTQVGRTLTKDQENLFRGLRARNMCKFCVVFNQFDKIWVHERDRYVKMSDFGKDEIEKLKEEKRKVIVTKLKQIDEEKNIYLTEDQYKANVKVVMTCMDFKFMQEEDKGRLAVANILSEQTLKEKVFDILMEEITNTQVRSKLGVERSMLYQGVNVKSCKFRRVVKSSKITTDPMQLTRNSEPSNQQKDQESFNNLKVLLKESLLINNNETLEIKTLSNVIIKTYDEILRSADDIFEVVVYSL